MVSSAKGGILAPHVHLEVLEEVVIFPRRERQQSAERARDCRIQQRLGTARYKCCSLQRCYSFTHVKINYDLSLL